jgi:hypothetical protein
MDDGLRICFENENKIELLCVRHLSVFCQADGLLMLGSTSFNVHNLRARDREPPATWPPRGMEVASRNWLSSFYRFSYDQDHHRVPASHRAYGGI